MEKVMRRICVVMLVGVVLGARLAAGPQDRAAEPAFEVVSVKPNTGERVARAAGPPDRFVAEMTLRDLIRLAWELPGFRIGGAPSWAESERFVINAKAPEVPAPGELRFMLQRMLRERFALRAHFESRNAEGYDLVLARTDRGLGPLLKPAALDCEPFLTGRRPMTESGVDQDGQMRCAARISAAGSIVTQQLNGARLSRLITSLENLLARSVVDKTGLQGSFNLELTFSTEGLSATNRAQTPSGSPEGPALVTALEEQLGLRLVPAPTRIEILVIDAVERPTPD
jgi:uncharacterized protein (TIGR03435 family)